MTISVRFELVLHPLISKPCFFIANWYWHTRTDNHIMGLFFKIFFVPSYLGIGRTKKIISGHLASAHPGLDLAPPKLSAFELTIKLEIQWIPECPPWKLTAFSFWAEMMWIRSCDETWEKQSPISIRPFPVSISLGLISCLQQDWLRTVSRLFCDRACTLCTIHRWFLIRSSDNLSLVIPNN